MTETKTVEDLESERRRLSLDAEENKQGAAEELERVEAELARYRMAEERSRLAEEEKARRAEEGRRHEEERDAKARRRKLKSIAKEHIEEAGQIEDAVDGLMGLLQSHLGRMDAFRAVNPTLTQHGGSLDMTRYLGDWLSDRLSNLPLIGRTFGRVEHLRAPLSEIERGRLAHLGE